MNKPDVIKPINRSSLILLIGDICLMTASYYIGLVCYFDFSAHDITKEFIFRFRDVVPFIAISGIIVFALFGLYKSILKFASVSDLLYIFLAFLVHQLVVLFFALMLSFSLPKVFWVIGGLCELVTLVVSRFASRVAFYIANKRTDTISFDANSNRVMIIGAGEAGRILIRELHTSNEVDFVPVCAIDDNPSKLNKSIDGVRIVGNRFDIVSQADAYDVDTILLAIPTIRPSDKKEILTFCQQTKCDIKVLPGLYQLLNESVSVKNMQEVSLDELLDRDAADINYNQIHSYISGKTVMVTGGGGSVGSELCRQIAENNPRQLIVFDMYENNAFAIQQELKRNYPTLSLIVLIGTIRDQDRINSIFSTYKPEIIFHCAAHKHVPLMENSPHEAIKNNVVGTLNVIKAADRYGSENFVLISSDKAVNPTNIMGASKCIDEMLIQVYNNKTNEYSNHQGCKYSSVRFGNVLGSNGSVIPLFKKQIKEGGPVTVTDKRIVRYFRTIPETVSLILQASAYSAGGEIFAIDMGEPVLIDDIARNLIKLSGFEPDVDIKIVYTGLRPGEKVIEELHTADEGLLPTDNSLINIVDSFSLDDEVFTTKLRELCSMSSDESTDIINKVCEIVDTYQPETGC